MRILEYTGADLIVLGLEARDKEHLLQQMVELLVKAGRVTSSQVILGELLKREHVMSTGIGGGIALPHARTDETSDLVLVFARTGHPLDFQALDSKPVDLVCMLIGPKGPDNVLVKLLARVSRLLQDESFKQGLREAATPADVLAVFGGEE